MVGGCEVSYRVAYAGWSGVGQGWSGVGGCAVDDFDSVVQARGDFGAGEQDALQIAGVGGGDLERRVFAGGAAAQGAHLIDRFGERELLADQALNEASAADFAAGFESAQGAEDFAPGHRDALAVISSRETAP